MTAESVSPSIGRPLDFNFSFGSRRPGATVSELEVRRKKFAPLEREVLSEGGCNYGGKCEACGGAMEFWYNYQLCDKCVGIKSGDVYYSKPPRAKASDKSKGY